MDIVVTVENQTVGYFSSHVQALPAFKQELGTWAPGDRLA
jgi:hypothetical protein